MYTVYVLQGKDGKMYKRMTNDLSRRIKEHKSGKTITTSKMENLKVVYTEECKNFIDARKREVYLKSAAGRRFLKTKLRTHSSAG